jgi:hypothetical protein
LSIRRWIMGDAPTPERQRVHAVAFDHPHKTITAVRAIREAGFEVLDTHGPFPIPGIEEAVGIKETRLPWATFVGGLAGFSLAFWFQVWTHTIDWPLNIGGKSEMALPGLIPVGFEVTILIAAIATVAALLLRSRLLPTFKSGTPHRQPSPRVTDDRFIVLVIERDGAFSPERFKAVVSELDPLEVIDSWRVT